MVSLGPEDYGAPTPEPSWRLTGILFGFIALFVALGLVVNWMHPEAAAAAMSRLVESCHPSALGVDDRGRPTCDALKSAKAKGLYPL